MTDAEEYMTIKMALISRLINYRPTVADIACNILTLGFNKRAWRREQRDIVELCNEYEASAPVRKALYEEYKLPQPKP